MRTMIAIALLSAWVTMLAPLASAADLVVKLPESQKPVSATATAEELKADIKGTIDGTSVTFKNVLPTTPYSVAIQLDDGSVLQGVNMNWYSIEPEKKDAKPLTDQDKKDIEAITKDIASFYNHNDVLIFNGTHNRCVGLMQFIRDKDFYADKGGELIWRIELYYYKFEYGGWEKVGQVNKILRRERFTSKAAYEKATKNLHWMPALGGIVIAKNEKTHLVDISKPPSTQPSKRES